MGLLTTFQHFKIKSALIDYRAMPQISQWAKKNYPFFYTILYNDAAVLHICDFTFICMISHSVDINLNSVGFLNVWGLFHKEWEAAAK